MELLNHVLRADPAAPRLSVYNESAGTRMDSSAQTLENWVSKIANMFGEELELDADSFILIDLPVSWQAAVIALGALATDVDFAFAEAATFADAAGSAAQPPLVDALFTAPTNYLTAHEAFPGADIVLVTDDPFGRGVAESGGDLPLGAIDFGPTVRFYGDQYFGQTTPLPELYPTELGPERVLSSGWHDTDSFRAAVLEPIAAGGSAVIVTGLCPAERLAEIAENEKVTLRRDGA
ncbi:TIGR03089 family protein [Corynebacterium sp.]|uniref:TIGR03089 family protein n=1 Tax=Corynebacterium sp. TaxID=1720 RepID=UPI0026DAE75E|nr:TIGR03089 family protein [Corynebacterium sp.]MDO5032125.1 TIGR03089 family protein [Corynebacterium sp.]